MEKIENNLQTDIIDLKECCEILKMKKPTVYRLVSSGTLPHYKPKGSSKLYFSRTKVLNWITNENYLS